MATPAITGSLLQSFSPIFVFLLIFAIMYAMFRTIKFLGDNKGIHAFIALILAIFAAFMSGSVTTLITFIVPWFSVIMVIVVLVLIIFAMFGASTDDFTAVIKSHGGVQWTIIIIAIVIVLIGLSQSFGQNSLGLTVEGSEGSPTEGVESTSVESTPSGTESTGIVRTTPTGDTGTGDFNQNVGATFFHPKIIGTIFILAIGSIATAMLTRKMVP